MNIEEYVDGNGNFTHTKVNGTQKQLEELIQKYRETVFFKSKTDVDKLIMEHYVFTEIIKTGMVPQGMLLELVMPSTNKKFRSFDEIKPGGTIEFDLPPRFRGEKTK